MRLIDADAFERRVMFDSGIEDLQDVIYALRDYESIADAVEVVRCKYCNHYDDGLCRRWKYSHVTSEDSFCSGAERKEE